MTAGIDFVELEDLVRLFISRQLAGVIGGSGNVNGIEGLPTPGGIPWGEAVYNSALGAAVPITDDKGAHLSVSRDGKKVSHVLTHADFVEAKSSDFVAPAYQSHDNIQYYRNTDTNVWYIFVILGQSNALGQNADASDNIIASTALYPGNAWMFASGPRRGLPENGTVNLIPLVEQAASLYKETALSGWVNHFIRDYNAYFGLMPNVLGFVSGVGATSFNGCLLRGSAGYVAFLQAMRDAVTAIKSKAGSAAKICTVVNIMQGESSLDEPTWHRVQTIKTFNRHMIADVKAITGEPEDPLLLFDQVARNMYLQGQDISWANWMKQAAVELDGVANIRLPGGDYVFPFNNGDNPTIHHSCLGHNRRGQQLARVTFAEVCGTSWLPLKPSKDIYWENPQTFYVRFDYYPAEHGGAGLVPLTMAFDNGQFISQVTSVPGAPVTTYLQNQGFQYRDRAAETLDGSGNPTTYFAGTTMPAISSVTASGPYLKFALSAPRRHAGDQLGYALAENYPGGTTAQGGGSGPIVGPRGNLRASTGHLSLYDGVTNFDFAPTFVIDL